MYGRRTYLKPHGTDAVDEARGPGICEDSVFALVFSGLAPLETWVEHLLDRLSDPRDRP